ncbi:MAG TPA: glycoside hydrolase family 13 protein [Candidatus Limnocylindrales bacterium]|nr:glycoside hydrolase family 13 protein [Candidatus Limnocylindrales bacterium]
MAGHLARGARLDRTGAAARGSVTVDTPGWVRDAVFYQIFPDRFAGSARVPKPGPLEPWDAPPTVHGFKGGDLLGIVEKLDYLQDLGVTAIYLTPIFQSASNHRYHTYDYLHVDPLLGGDAALRELLDVAHGRGMRVILDGVFNHTGRGFWPFHHILENGAASPYRDWFHIDLDVLEGRREFVPYPPPDAPPGTNLGYQAWWGLPALPKLNTDNPEVREYLLSVAEHWLRFGADGWRLDVPAEIDDPAFWAAFRQRCRAVREDAYLVGEVWVTAPEWVAGDRFDALMDYPLAEAILGYVAGPSLDQSAVDSHHEYREHLRPLDGPAFGHRLSELLGVYDPDVVAVQLNLLSSHDAPRALTVLSGDRDAMRMAVLLQAMLPGAPCIYYGDEIGLTGGNDPANRGAFPWDAERWDHELRDFTRAVLAQRRAQQAIRHGATAVAGAFGSAIAIERRLDEDRLLVALNAAVDPVELEITIEGVEHGWLSPVELPGVDRLDPIVVTASSARVPIPPRSGRVLRVARDAS